MSVGTAEFYESYQGRLWWKFTSANGFYTDDRPCVTVGYNRSERAWRVIWAGGDANDDYLMFGPVRLGGTKAEAIEAAARVVYKNDFKYVAPEDVKRGADWLTANR